MENVPYNSTQSFLSKERYRDENLGIRRTASFPVSQFPQLNKSMDVILSIVREMISLEHRPLLIEYFPGFVDDEAPPPT
jgi:hypothetical protein